MASNFTYHITDRARVLSGPWINVHISLYRITRSLSSYEYHRRTTNPLTHEPIHSSAKGVNPFCCSAHVSIYPVIDTPKVPSLSTPSSPFPGLGIYSAREGLSRGPLGHDVLPNRTDATVTNSEIIRIFGFGSDDNQLDRGKNQIRIRSDTPFPIANPI